MPQTVSVSELNRYLKELISTDPNLRRVTVRGEISNFTNHAKSGHFYFTLKDETASIKAVMFRGNAQKVRFRVENGMNVLVTGGVSVFERDGVYQLYCDEMEPDGIGALFLAFEQLKEKLAGKGYFDPEHKRPLPPLPTRIGVVTSQTGAALQDIRNILSRRWPLATLVVIPALVQGEQAAPSIVEAIHLAGSSGKLDLLIVGRGGGSIEDLWCFNDERVARAIYNCPVPVISAVGHEIDFTIADFTADLRAPTPSAAAELCAPDIAALRGGLASAEAALESAALACCKRSRERLKTTYLRLTALSPEVRIRRDGQTLASCAARLSLAGDRLVKAKTERMIKAAAQLEAMSPLRVLTRGYTLTYRGEELLTSAAALSGGDRLITRFGDGSVESIVTMEESEEQIRL